MLYVVIVIGTTYYGNTNLVTSQTKYTPDDSFHYTKAMLAVDPPITAPNPHGAKINDVAFYIGSFIDSNAQAGDLAFLSNTQENLLYPAISGAGKGQGAALDTSYETFNANTLTLQVDPQAGIAVQLNRFEIDSGLTANEYEILDGTFTMTFSGDKETISGAATFFGSGYIYPGSAAVQVNIQGVAFNAFEYLASNLNLVPSLGVDAKNATNHYLTYGFNEGRPYDFDGLEYICSYGDLISKLGVNRDSGAIHYINFGAKEGRTLKFDSWEYIASYPGLIVALGPNKMKGAAHYIQHGYAEGRVTSFDGLEYIASYGDLISAYVGDLSAFGPKVAADDGAEHYIQHGYHEGRSTHLFNAAQYLANYADLRNAYGTDLEAAREHYILYGYWQGRTDKPLSH